MSKVYCLTRVVVLAWMVSATVSAWAGGGYLHDSVGSVSVATGKDTPRPALTNDSVTSGTVIRTGDNSHAVLKFEDGQVVSLQSNSTLKVRRYDYDPQQVEKSNISFSMFKGGMHFVTGLIGQRNHKAFRLATPNATISIQGTDFYSVITQDGLYNQVLSGSIVVTNNTGSSVLTAGNIALIASSDSRPVSISPAVMPAGIFSHVPAIIVQSTVPGVAPLPALIAAPAPALPPVAITTAIYSTAGGAATGGSTAVAVEPPVVTAGTGLSGTVIAIGMGVAIGVAALVSTTDTGH
ncbi:MAG: FecR family protein [Gallionella sp.]|nr:FecR family protein [Gallionella sp.]